MQGEVTNSIDLHCLIKLLASSLPKAEQRILNYKVLSLTYFVYGDLKPFFQEMINENGTFCGGSHIGRN
jgi:hypothetical protein